MLRNIDKRCTLCFFFQRVEFGNKRGENNSAVVNFHKCNYNWAIKNNIRCITQANEKKNMSHGGTHRVIPALWRLKKEGFHEVKSTLGYIASSRPLWATLPQKTKATKLVVIFLLLIHSRLWISGAVFCSIPSTSTLETSVSTSLPSFSVGFATANLCHSQRFGEL